MDLIIGDIDQGYWFDMALRSAEGWMNDAQFYSGDRRQMRLDRAKEFELIAEKILAEV